MATLWGLMKVYPTGNATAHTYCRGDGLCEVLLGNSLLRRYQIVCAQSAVEYRFSVFVAKLCCHCELAEPVNVVHAAALTLIGALVRRSTE